MAWHGAGNGNRENRNGYWALDGRRQKNLLLKTSPKLDADIPTYPLRSMIPKCQGDLGSDTDQQIRSHEIGYRGSQMELGEFVWSTLGKMRRLLGAVFLGQSIIIKVFLPPTHSSCGSFSNFCFQFSIIFG